MRRLPRAALLLIPLAPIAWIQLTTPETRRPLVPVTVEPLSAMDFWDVSDAIATEDGFWVLSKDEPFLVHIDRQGRPVGRLGARGAGPRELESPTHLLGTPEGVVVLDPVHERALLASGDSLREWAWPGKRTGMIRGLLADLSYIDPFKIEPLGDALVTARFPGDLRFPGDVDGGVLARLASDRSEVDTIAELGARSATPAPRFLARSSLWDSCGDELAIFDHRAGTISWVDSTGETIGHTDVGVSSVGIPRRALLGYLVSIGQAEAGGRLTEAELEPQAQRILEQSPGLFPRRSPLATGLLCGGDLTLLGLFDPWGPSLGKSTDWVVLEQQRPTATVRFPRNFRPLLLENDIAYGILEGPHAQSFALAVIPRSIPSTPKQREAQ